MPMEDFGSSEAYLMVPKINQENSLKINAENGTEKKQTSKISGSTEALMSPRTNQGNTSKTNTNKSEMECTPKKSTNGNTNYCGCSSAIRRKEKENYSALVSFLSKMGGHNLYEFIKRCIGPLLSDNVVIHYSYIRRKGKKRFDKIMALSKAIIGKNLLKLPILPKTKNPQTEVNISVWLRKATERKTRLDRNILKNTL